MKFQITPVCPGDDGGDYGRRYSTARAIGARRLEHLRQTGYHSTKTGNCSPSLTKKAILTPRERGDIVLR